MARGIGAALGVVLGAVLVFAAPAGAASKNVKLQDNLPGAKYATAINFLQYKQGEDVMLVTGRFGLQTYSLRDPSHPELLDSITNEDLRLRGDPPTNLDESAGPLSTFWQNEDMEADLQRKLEQISRDPRSY